jgi:hypothetical protein
MRSCHLSDLGGFQVFLQRIAIPPLLELPLKKERSSAKENAGWDVVQ